MWITRSLTSTVVLLALVSPAPALAADSSVQGYGSPGGNVQTQVGDPSATSRVDSLGAPVVAVNPQRDAGNRALPFTGADLLFTAAVGAVLLGAGFGMRRWT
jgi:hypothetical protein